MGFGFHEKLGHLVEDSVKKEKGRVHFDRRHQRPTNSYLLNKM